MLASDLNNPAFAGPQNPDDLLAVEFYDYAAIDTWKTQETGIKAFRAECPFVRISIPGTTHFNVERPATEADAKKWPRQWQAYQMSTGKAAVPEDVPGWKLEDWPDLNAEQVRQLKFLRFYTVEQIAAANDAQVQGIGMGGEGLKRQARKALEARNAVTANSEIAKRDAEIAELRAKLDRVLEMLPQPEEKRGPGRPRKDEPQAA